MNGSPMPTSQPQIQPSGEAVKKSFFQTLPAKILLGLIAVVILAVPLVLNYFNVISLNLTFLSKSSSQEDLKAARISSIPANLALTCPVEEAFCQTKNTQKFQNGEAITYKASSGSKVYNAVKIESRDNIAVSENNEANQKYLYISTVQDNSCYIIKYTLPLDTILGDILLAFPQAGDKRIIAILKDQLLKISNKDVNVMIQVLKFPLDQDKCSLSKKSPQFFK